MQSNKLKLNTEKTLVNSSVRISSVGCESVDICGSSCYVPWSASWPNTVSVALPLSCQENRSKTTPRGSSWKNPSMIMSHRFWKNCPSKISHSVQARNARFPSLRRHSFAIPVFFSLHISTIALPSFFDRTTAHNSKDKLESLRWTFFCLLCSDGLELTAGRPESFSLPPKSGRVG